MKKSEESKIIKFKAKKIDLKINRKSKNYKESFNNYNDDIKENLLEDREIKKDLIRDLAALKYNNVIIKANNRAY